MINFCIKFLICFIKPQPPPKKESKAKQATKAGNKSRKNTPLVPEVPVSEPDEEKDPNVVKCAENAREWCHIEYSLLDNVLPKVEINVVTWGEAAKVITEGDSRSVKTALINDFVWVYFEMCHKTSGFSDEDLITFKDTKITFTFSQDVKKMMSAASNDWPKQFEFCDKLTDIDEDVPRWFTELRQVDPPDEKYEPFRHKLDSYKIFHPDKRSIVSLINVVPCEKGIESKINEISASLPAVEQPTEPPMKGKGKKVGFTKESIGKNTGKKGKGDQPQENNSQLTLDAGLLIAGKYNASSERKEITQTLRYAAVYVNSTKIIADDQDITYVPFIVSIHSFEAFPLENLQQLNVNKVFARYELANVLEKIETQKVSAQENMIIDDTRVFFLSSPEERSDYDSMMERPSMLALAEALLTRRFVVKIYGETAAEERQIEPCIFGDRPTDPFISTPDHEMFLNYRSPPSCNTEIFIGSASVNLIQLIKGYSMVEACSIVTSSPLSSWDPTCDFAEITDDLKNNETRKTLLSTFTTSGAIPESAFIERNSRVKLRISLSSTCRLTVPEDYFLLKMENVSHRAIIIFEGNSYNERVIKLIEQTNTILQENFIEKVASCVTAQSVQFVRNPSVTSHVSLLSARLSECPKLNLTLKEISKKRDVPKATTTGFFIEQEDQSILVFEAMTYVIPPLITQIQSLLKSEDCARVICDSSIFFTRRLYEECSPSIFRIKLPVSLDSLLKTPSYYTKQSMLDESLQTLLLLDLLRRSRTLYCACVNQLFPSCKQLISFNNVFGIGGNSEDSDLSSLEISRKDSAIS